MPIAAASLKKVTGDAHVGDLYLRVSVDGQALNVEGYEDGSYIDSLEIREYTQVPMPSSGQGAEEGSDLLQTGEKYIMAWAIPKTSLEPMRQPCSIVGFATKTENSEYFPSLARKQDNSIR